MHLVSFRDFLKSFSCLFPDLDKPPYKIQCFTSLNIPVLNKIHYKMKGFNLGGTATQHVIKYTLRISLEVDTDSLE